MTLGPGGRVLEGKLGGLLDLKAEKEDMARRLDGEAVDLLTASAVRVDQPLGDPEKIRSLKLRVLGFGDFAIPASHRQRVSRQDDGAVLLELERDSRAAQATPLAPEQVAVVALRRGSVHPQRWVGRNFDLNMDFASATIAA